MNTNRQNTQHGFTLLELLVVISIIGFLASIMVVNVSRSRMKARDTVRRQQLVQLQKAIELYFENTGGYPSTANAWVASEPGAPGITTDSANYIPGLVSAYVARLPRDPLGGSGSAVASICSGWPRTFLYRSDGVNYKLLSLCSPEIPIVGADALNDPSRDNGPTNWTTACDGAGDNTLVWAWSVFSSGARCW